MCIYVALDCDKPDKQTRRVETACGRNFLEALNSAPDLIAILHLFSQTHLFLHQKVCLQQMRKTCMTLECFFENYCTS